MKHTTKQLDINIKAVIIINNSNVCVNIIKRRFKFLPCWISIPFTHEILSHFHCVILDEMPEEIKSGSYSPFMNCMYYRKEDFNITEIINEKYKIIRKQEKLAQQIKSQIQ